MSSGYNTPSRWEGNYSHSHQSESRIPVRQEHGVGLNIRFDNPSVCRGYLVGCCPHDVLSSTSIQIGDCSRIHHPTLKSDYECAIRKLDYYSFDVDALGMLRKFILALDKKKWKARRELDELETSLSAKKEKIEEYSEKIERRLRLVEQLGTKGCVEKSLELMREVEELRDEMGTAKIDYNRAMSNAKPKLKELRVCQDCGSPIGYNDDADEKDDEERLNEHVRGKLHKGVVKIRETIKDLEDSVEIWKRQHWGSRNQRLAKMRSGSLRDFVPDEKKPRWENIRPSYS